MVSINKGVFLKKKSFESKRVTFLFLVGFPQKLARILNRKGFNYSQSTSMLSNMVLI